MPSSGRLRRTALSRLEPQVESERISSAPPFTLSDSRFHWCGSGCDGVCIPSGRSNRRESLGRGLAAAVPSGKHAHPSATGIGSKTGTRQVKPAESTTRERIRRLRRSDIGEGVQPCACWDRCGGQAVSRARRLGSNARYWAQRPQRTVGALRRANMNRPTGSTRSSAEHRREIAGFRRRWGHDPDNAPCPDR